jgi:hypothetical protein
MSLLTKAGDLVYTFRFLKLLVQKWEDTDAYKLGIVDEKGKRIKSKGLNTSEERGAYTTFHRLVYNIKRLLEKVPGGSSRLGTYAAALFLLKEHFGVTEKNMQKILKQSGLEVTDLLEEQHNWYVLQTGQVAPGVYRVKNNKLLSDTLDEIVNAKDKIKICEDCFPIDDVFGINIYEGTHINTGQKIHFTLGEIYK